MEILELMRQRHSVQHMAQFGGRRNFRRQPFFDVKARGEGAEKSCFFICH